VTAALLTACEYLQADGRIRGNVSAVLNALLLVLDAQMSRGQQLRVLYALCVCHAAEDPPTPALEPTDEALALAMEAHEDRVQVDLLLLRAYVNRCIWQVPDAADDLDDCLKLLVNLRLREEWEAADAQTTLGALARRAAQVFLLGHYDECQWWLDKADELLPQVHDDIDMQGRLAWVRALALRWRGAYDDALHEAPAAVGYYRRLHNPEMLSRIEGETGQTLLDLAEQQRARGYASACERSLQEAEGYINRAIKIAVDNDFLGSEIGAHIIRARLLLLQGVPGDHRPLLKELARVAWKHQDMAGVSHIPHPDSALFGNI
jgi:tetratricopeptide (TPR) repeat protein